MVRNLSGIQIQGNQNEHSFPWKMWRNIEKFLTGQYDTSFINTTPELFVFPKQKDRGTKMLTYIGNVTVNGFPGMQKEEAQFDKPQIVKTDVDQPIASGTKQILDERGAEGLVKWVKDQAEVLLTDTTFRDAHQSLLATRVRTHDLKKDRRIRRLRSGQNFSVLKCGAAPHLMSLTVF